MKIDLDWIQKELDAGREVELECVDRKGFLSSIDEEIGVRLLNNSLSVTKSSIDKCYLKDNEFLFAGELEYFRIKQASTFDDLIDVAVRAAKDDVIVIRRFHSSFLDLEEYGTTKHADNVGVSSSSAEDIKDAIDFINSLYTETFVIEDFQDTKKLKSGAKAILSNGEEVVFSNRTGVDDSLWFKYNGCYSDGCYRAIIPYIALKGATVTQQKGNK